MGAGFKDKTRNAKIWHKQTVGRLPRPAKVCGHFILNKSLFELFGRKKRHLVTMSVKDKCFVCGVTVYSVHYNYAVYTGPCAQYTQARPGSAVMQASEIRYSQGELKYAPSVSKQINLYWRRVYSGFSKRGEGDQDQNIRGHIGALCRAFNIKYKINLLLYKTIQSFQRFPMHISYF